MGKDGFSTLGLGVVCGLGALEGWTCLGGQIAEPALELLSPSVAVPWFSIRLHSFIIAIPLPENTLHTASVCTQLLPVARKTPSSHAENHIVR